MVEMLVRPFASLTLRGAAVAALLAPLWLAGCGSSGGDTSGAAGSTGAGGAAGAAGTMGSAGTTGSAGGGGSGGSIGTGGTTGSGSPFCSEWAAVFCRRVWECEPDPASNPFALGSEAACAAGYAMLCSQPQPAGQTFSVNCSGKQVNQAAETSCLNRLNTVSCADFNATTYDDDCDMVCTG